MKIAKNTVVSIDYTLKDDEGSVIDTSDGRGPLSFIQGIGNIIPGLEKKLEDKQVGDSFQVSISPEEGYGERDETLRQIIPSSAFQGISSLEVGMQFQMQTNQGVQIASIVDIEGDNVTIDSNHPLAGLNLNFAVTVTDVRQATEEELNHGHVHQPGCHHH